MRPQECNEQAELRGPGMRRILEAIEAIRQERPGFVEKASRRGSDLAAHRADGGRIPGWRE
jgi:hypothetical protein